MNHYLTIKDKKYRIEANWNAITAFLEAKGEDNMTALANVGNIKPSDITYLMAACINEGERMDGRESNLDHLTIGEMCSMSEIAEFVQIYAKQSTPDIEQKKKD